MRKKQLLAFLMAGALSVGMTPAAAFAAEDTAVEASGEEVAGELDGTDAAEAPAEETTEEDTPAESETPAEETADNTDTAETPAEEETPAENTAEEEAPAQAEETQTPAEETTETAAIMINETAYGSLAEAFAALPDTSDPINDPTYIKIRGEIEVAASVEVPAGKKCNAGCSRRRNNNQTCGWIYRKYFYSQRWYYDDDSRYDHRCRWKCNGQRQPECRWNR